MSKTPRVYLLSNQLGAGGVPRVIYNVCANLTEDDAKIRIGYLGGNNDMVEPLEELGYTVEKLGDGFPELSQLGAVRHAIRSYDPDVLHTHMVPAGVLGHLTSIGSDWSVISTVHNIYSEHTRFAKLMDYPASHLCDHVVSVSNAVDTSLPESYGLGAERRIIHNCIDAETVRSKGAKPFGEIPWRDRIDRSGPIIANVARFSPRKRQRDLIAAMPAVLAEHPDAQLVLTGWGERTELLTNMAVEHGVREQVIFLQKVDNPYAVYNHADLVAFPSEFEGFSIGLLEAMAFGTPVVASDIMPFVEALGRDYPVFPVGNRNALAEQLVKVLSDSEQSARLGAQLRNRVDERFAGDRAAREHAELYNLCCDRGVR